MVPGGPVSQYSATDTGGTLTFAPQLVGSAEGSAVITAFIAE